MELKEVKRYIKRNSVIKAEVIKWNPRFFPLFSDL